MVKIEDKIGEWCGELKFTTDDEVDFCLKPRLEHKRKLMFLQKKFDGQNFTEEDISAQDNILIQVIKESYPSFTSAQIEGLVQNYGTEILIELYCAWRWRDRSAIEALKVKQKKELDKMLNE